MSLYDDTVLNVVMPGTCTQATALSLHLLLLACITNNKPRKFSWLPLDYYGGYTTENGPNVKCMCWIAYRYCIWRVQRLQSEDWRQRLWKMGDQHRNSR
jgi:hypothetical protein